jgi:hypothetical protein
VTSLNEHLPSLAKMGPPDLSPAMTGRAAAIT